jgi:hypothetical protein
MYMYATFYTSDAPTRAHELSRFVGTEVHTEGERRWFSSDSGPDPVLHSTLSPTDRAAERKQSRGEASN